MSHTAEGIPGEEFLYSGALYGLLTGVIERVEHKPYAGSAQRANISSAATERHIRRIARRQIRAEYKICSVANCRRVSSLIRQTHEAAPLSIDLSRISTATGVISDIGDLVKYAVALDGDKLLPRATMELISTPQRSTRGGTLPYGLGWFAEEYLGRTNRLALRPRAQLFESVCARTIETSHFHHAREFRRAKRCAAAQRW